MNPTVPTKSTGDPITAAEINSIVTAIATKVDVDSAKVLSDNNYTTAEKTKVANTTGVNTGDQDLSGKVDKVAGKQLSTNDYTNTEQTKLAAISGTNSGDETGASIIAKLGYVPVPNSITVNGKALNANITLTADDVAEKSASPTNLYFTAARAQATPVGALTLTNTAISATDTVNTAFGKLQAQVSGNTSAIPAKAASADATSGTDDAKFMTALKTAQAIAALTPGSFLQSETTSFISNILAADGGIDAQTIMAVDRFVSVGKQSGWWAQLVDVCPFVGTNLASALVRLKTPSGLSTSLTNNNFTEADFDQILGLGYDTAYVTGKYIGTGTIPTSQGMTNTAISFGMFNVNDQPGSQYGWNSGLNPVSTECPLAQTESGIGITPSYNPRLGRGLRLVNYNGALQQTYWNAIIVQDITTFSTSVALNTEMTLFKVTRNGTVYYERGRFGFYFLGKALTKAQAGNLARAIEVFNIAIGRYPQPGGVAMFMGDSITSGQGQSTTQGRWPYIAAEGVGMVEYNLGAPSSQLRQTTPLAVGGYPRYTDFLAIPANVVFIMYGTNDMNNNGGNADTSTNGDATIIADFKTKLTTMINGYTANRLKVIVCSPPYNSTSNATKIQAYMVACRDVARTCGVTFVDTYTPMLDTGNPGGLMADVNHPNTAGHALIGKRAISGYRGAIYRDVTLTFPSIAAGASSDLVISLHGANIGNAVTMGQSATATAGIIMQAFVNANDSVTIRATNITVGALTPVSDYYRVSVVVA